MPCSIAGTEGCSLSTDNAPKAALCYSRAWHGGWYRVTGRFRGESDIRQGDDSLLCEFSRRISSDSVQGSCYS